MDEELKRWAITEREFLREDIRWLRAGAKLLSPSGDDITAKRIAELEARLEHVRLAIGA